jgi:DNA-binding CsgD family transcriptional regulator
VKSTVPLSALRQQRAVVRAMRRANTSSFEKILSDTEQVVLSLVGEGLSDAEIAVRIGISRTTAQTHRSRIMKKLQIKGTPKLMAFAARNGFARLPSRSPFPA